MVIIIVATLAAIAAPTVQDATLHAREAQLRANLNLVRKAMDQFNADTGYWPRSLSSLTGASKPTVVNMDSFPLTPVASPANLNYNGPYLNYVPLDPMTESNFSVSVTNLNGRLGVRVSSSSTDVGSDGKRYNTY